jgi:hypothetical protein
MNDRRDAGLVGDEEESIIKELQVLLVEMARKLSEIEKILMN